jgi:hypothetical protein
MHSEITRILRPDAAERVQRRHDMQRAELAQVETRALAKLLGEGWHVSHDCNGNWVATQEGR